MLASGECPRLGQFVDPCPLRLGCPASVQATAVRSRSNQRFAAPPSSPAAQLISNAASAGPTAPMISQLASAVASPNSKWADRKVVRHSGSTESEAQTQLPVKRLGWPSTAIPRICCGLQPARPIDLFCVAFAAGCTSSGCLTVGQCAQHPWSPHSYSRAPGQRTSESAADSVRSRRSRNERY